MPRIIVTSDHAFPSDAVVLLDEQVVSAQLNDDRDVLRFIERLGWAISDAEDAAAGAARNEAPPPSRTPDRLRVRVNRGRLRTRRRAGSPVASLLPRESA